MVGGIGGPGGSGPSRPEGGPGKVSGPNAPGTPGATETTKGAKETSFSETLSRGVNETKGVSQAAPLDRLRAGEIDRTQYVELKVHEATAHLDGVLPAEDVARIQDELRDVLENDPDVAALVKRAEVG